MSKLKRKVLDDLKRDVFGDLALEAQYAATIEATRQELGDEPPLLVESREDERANEIIDEASAGLAQDGRDYIAALFWMMTGAKFSEVTRTFVCAIVAYEDCKDRDARGGEITDAEVSEFMGCSERTIQRRRAQYFTEEKSLKIPFLQITEGDYDKELKTNRPTRYRFLRDLDVADAVLEARQTSLYQEDRRKALKLSALRVYDSLAKPLGTAAVRRRKKKELSPDSERKRLMNTIRTSVAKLREVEDRMEGFGDGDWDKLKSELEAIYKSSNPRQVVAEIKHNPMGRHSVAPSDDEVRVSSELPSDAPLSEYLRVPSLAREARRTRERQEGAGYG